MFKLTIWPVNQVNIGQYWYWADKSVHKWQILAVVFFGVFFYCPGLLTGGIHYVPNIIYASCHESNIQVDLDSRPRQNVNVKCRALSTLLWIWGFRRFLALWPQYELCLIWAHPSIYHRLSHTGCQSCIKAHEYKIICDLEYVKRATTFCPEVCLGILRIIRSTYLLWMQI